MADAPDDEMLKALANLMKAEASLDPRLERLARGELSELERARLEADARGDHALAADVELHRPLSEEARERMVQLAQARRATGPGGAALRLLRSQGPLRISGVLGLAAAAVLGLVLGRPPPLPEFELAVRAGDRPFRGERTPEAALPVARIDSEIAIVMRPMSPIEGVTEARLFVIDEEGAWPSPTPAERSTDGAARWRGRAGDLAGGRVGDLRFVAVVGRPGAPPAPARLVEGPARGRDWQSAVLAMRLQPDDGP